MTEGVNGAAGDPSRVYELLLLRQARIPIEGVLGRCGPFGRDLRCHTQEWRDGLNVLPDRGPLDLIIPLFSGISEEAMRLLRWLDQRRVQAPTLAVLPAETSDLTLAAVSRVVDDFILWPFRTSELDQRLGRILSGGNHQLESIRSLLNSEMGLSSLVGNDPTFLRMIESLPRVAAREETVLISGETGTGKELCARAIHHLSPRRNFAFVPVDCGAFPEQLLENELFGHARGAFTDARTDHKGLAAIAEGGTLFLDEIDALSLTSQAKLLRFLEDRIYKPLGSERFARANIRIVAATNRDLETCVQEKVFRVDLYYRVNVFRLRMTPLRERRGDVAALANHFIQSVSGNAGRRTLSSAALRRLMLYDWPGNVRELLNVIQRAVALSDGTQILSSHISIPSPILGDEATAVGFREGRARAIGEFEKSYLEEILSRHGGNITRAAREAGKDRRALGRLVKKHQIARCPA